MTFHSIFKMLQSFESKSNHAFNQTNIFVQILISQKNCKPFVLFRTRTNLFPKTLLLPIIHFYPSFNVIIKLPYWNCWNLKLSLSGYLALTLKFMPFCNPVIPQTPLRLQHPCPRDVYSLFFLRRQN